MTNLNVKYPQIKADDVALIRWSENLYKRTPVYIGLLNDFIVVVCTQTSGIEYDSVVIRFRLRNYESINDGKAKSKNVTAIYRDGYTLSDLKEGLWLTTEELLKVNNEILRLLDEFKMEFITVK
jgi:hypothetical protein